MCPERGDLEREPDGGRRGDERDDAGEIAEAEAEHRQRV